MSSSSSSSKHNSNTSRTIIAIEKGLLCTFNSIFLHYTFILYIINIRKRFVVYVTVFISLLFIFVYKNVCVCAYWIQNVEIPKNKKNYCFPSRFLTSTIALSIHCWLLCWILLNVLFSSSCSSWVYFFFQVKVDRSVSFLHFKNHERFVYTYTVCIQMMSTWMT